MHLERQASGFPPRDGTAAQPCRAGSAKKTSSASTDTVPDSIFDKIENVADQVQQVGARAMNRAGELDLFRSQVAVGVVGELLAENQNAVQRRAQLVRHVGQELRLVLRGERQFLGLFFQCAAGLFDFLVLAFDFDVLFGELLRFLRQLFVGLLQFFLLRLKFGRQLLRLLQQAFGLHRGFDTVQHDTDAGGQLFQESQVRGGEGAQEPVRSRLSRDLRTAPEARSRFAEQLRTSPTEWDTCIGGRSVISMRRFSDAHCPTRPSPI